MSRNRRARLAHCDTPGLTCIRSEAVAGALPVGQNSPQKPAHGLYAEKLSGTSFTAPRHENQQSWLYRILPSCVHEPFAPAAPSGAAADAFPTPGQLHYLPNQLRWDPFEQAADGEGGADFVSGLRLVAGAGDPALKQGLGIYVFAAGRSMGDREAFYSADGDLLVVAQDGVLDIRTELGWLLVRPMELCVLPRGIKYQVRLPAGPARGYALELYEGHFALPELGPIGSNGLANARDFQAPVACFSEDHPGSAAADTAAEYTITAKFGHGLFRTRQTHTPFDVVAWHGTYYPYKYDLGRFNALGSATYDHPDPSIYTVLTAASARRGTAVADVVVFPPRWLVGEDTFRPPWYHRNAMAEFMGLVRGAYDARRAGPKGFAPGGASLHNVMSGHGPDAATAGAAREAVLRPAKVGEGSCAFMFETCLMLGVTEWGLRTCRRVQEAYCEESWGGVPVHWKRPEGVDDGRHLV